MSEGERWRAAGGFLIYQTFPRSADCKLLPGHPHCSIPCCHANRGCHPRIVKECSAFLGTTGWQHAQLMLTPHQGILGLFFPLDLPVPGDNLPLICSFKMPSSLLDLIRTPSHDKQPSPDPCTSIVNQIQQSKQFFAPCNITPPPCSHCCCGAGRAEGSMQGWGGANLQCRAAEGPCASMGSFRVCLKLVKQMSCRATQETKFDDLCFSPSG